MGGGSAETKSRRACKCCDASEGLRRGAWAAQEDRILTSYINTHGEGKWRQLPQKAGLRRCGRSCRLRWLNYLRHDIKRGNISEDEEDLIIRLHKLLGNRWSLIAGRLPGRTDNEIKNYWNTHLMKKLQGKSKTPKKKSTRSKIKKVEGLSSMEVPTVTLQNDPHFIQAKAPECNNAFPPRPEGTQKNSDNHERIWDVENSIPMVSEFSDFLDELRVSDFLDSDFLQVPSDEIQVANEATVYGGPFLTNKQQIIEGNIAHAAYLEDETTSNVNVLLNSSWELS